MSSEKIRICVKADIGLLHTDHIMVKGRGRVIPYSSREYNHDHIFKALKNAYVVDCIKWGPSSPGLLSGDRGTGTLGI